MNFIKETVVFKDFYISSDTNSVALYTFDKEEQGSTIWFDKIIIEEYNQNKEFIQNVYEFSFAYL